MTAEAGSRGQLARRAGVVSVAVLASRVLGLVREQVFAVSFGAGRVLDAYVTAFRIPNLLRDLFAEGALSAAFVSTFTQRARTNGEARGLATRQPGRQRARGRASGRSACWASGARPPSRMPSRPGSRRCPASSS